MGHIRFFFLSPSGENSRSQRKKNIWYACMQSFCYLIHDWLELVHLPLHDNCLVEKPHYTKRETWMCVHEEEKHEYLNLFFSMVAYDVCFHIDKTKESKFSKRHESIIWIWNYYIFPPSSVDSHNNVVWMNENESYHSLS